MRNNKDKQYILKKRYPGLPKDWQPNKLIIGYGDNNTGFLSPISSSVLDKKISESEVLNFPEYWEDYRPFVCRFDDNNNIISVKRNIDGERFNIGDEVFYVSRSFIIEQFVMELGEPFIKTGDKKFAVSMVTKKNPNLIEKAEVEKAVKELIDKLGL